MKKTNSAVGLLFVATCSCVATETGENDGKFGKVVRKAVYDDLPTAACLIDFDKGKVSKPTSGPLRSDDEAIAYFKKTGFDASGEGDHIVGVEMIAKRVKNSFWNDPKGIEALLAKEKPRTPLRIRPNGKFPCTFVIKTREGGQGVMRFTKSIPGEEGRQPLGLEIEYKLLRKTKSSGSTKPARGSD